MLLSQRKRAFTRDLLLTGININGRLIRKQMFNKIKFTPI